MNDLPTVSLRRLLDDLKNYDPDKTEVFFGGLGYYRVKARADSMVQIEFTQNVYLNDEGLVEVDNLE